MSRPVLWVRFTTGAESARAQLRQTAGDGCAVLIQKHSRGRAQLPGRVVLKFGFWHDDIPGCRFSKFGMREPGDQMNLEHT